ncbi:MAG: hypothetical protein GKR89_00205 [Candidatus Latescibacteria bacterium]|nr:hypothetical protein [Candidatus Latescibacterota bacterium]
MQKHPLIGLSEWMCYYTNYHQPCPGAAATDQCVDLHAEAGFDILVWNLGRSVVDYWSGLSQVTRMCQVSDQVGGHSWAFVGQVMAQVCPLRRALKRAAQDGLSLWGRLGMNRHYGSAAYAGVTSRFALDNPQFHERGKNGGQDASRLCYALEEVRRERIDILLECHRLGVAGLVLDFCRQMPMLKYHPALVDPFRQQTGIDPLGIDSDEPADYAAWFQYRADILTQFMDELRQGLKQQEAQYGPCPLIARIPDSAPWLLMAYGLDTGTWCARDLIDGLMLSPFPITREDLQLHTADHVQTAHKHGKICWGGLGSKQLLVNGSLENTGSFHLQPALSLAAAQYAAGVDGLSLYQSESMVRMRYLDDLLATLPYPEPVAERAASLAVPDLPADHGLGMDWHAHMRGRHSLRSAAGDNAL